MSPYTIAAYGFIGAICVQIVVLVVRSAQGAGFSPNQILLLAVNAIISGMLAAGYFVYLEQSEPTFLLAAHYGLFIALVIQEIEDFLIPTATTGEQTPIPTTFSLLAVAPALILNGFWPVFGVGAFGAFAAEAYSFQRERKKRIELPTSYWIIAAVLVFVGGGVTALHGIENVSAVVAFQLGASPPLFYKQVKGK